MPGPWPLIKGLLTRVPGLYGNRAAALGGAISARYCYSVWLRHLVALHDAGMSQVPRSVAELGPGLSLGIGLAALLGGTERYVALDVSRDASYERHAELLTDLAALWTERAAIPDDAEFPEVLPRLTDYQYPAWLRDRAIDARRLDAVRALLEGIRSGFVEVGKLSLDYRVPWMEEPGSGVAVDLVLAQAVLEHVRDPLRVYRAMTARLRPGGFLSYTIDFRSHGLTPAWNGHWAYSPRAWRTVEGARSWGLNRWGLSQHLRALGDAGFTVLRIDREERASGIRPDQLHRSLRHLDPADLATCSAFIVAMNSTPAA